MLFMMSSKGISPHSFRMLRANFSPNPVEPCRLTQVTR